MQKVTRTLNISQTKVTLENVEVELSNNALEFETAKKSGACLFFRQVSQQVLTRSRTLKIIHVMTGSCVTVGCSRGFTCQSDQTRLSCSRRDYKLWSLSPTAGHLICTHCIFHTTGHFYTFGDFTLTRWFFGIYFTKLMYFSNKKACKTSLYLVYKNSKVARRIH